MNALSSPRVLPPLTVPGRRLRRRRRTAAWPAAIAFWLAVLGGASAAAAESGPEDYGAFLGRVTPVSHHHDSNWGSWNPGSEFWHSAPATPASRWIDQTLFTMPFLVIPAAKLEGRIDSPWHGSLGFGSVFTAWFKVGDDEHALPELVWLVSPRWTSHRPGHSSWGWNPWSSGWGRGHGHGHDHFPPDCEPIPEPSTAVIIAGFAGIGLIAWRTCRLTRRR